MNASERDFSTPAVRITSYNTKPFNPADYNIEPKTAEIKGGPTVEVRATCVGCNQRCFITTDGACIPASHIATYSWKNRKDLSPVGAVLKVQCQSTLVLQKARSNQKAA